MQPLSLTKYAAYIQEKAGFSLIEWDNAFITYSISGDNCFIGDLWVDADYRREKIAWKLADHLSEIAKNNGCKRLTSTAITNSNGIEAALMTQFAYGFRIIGSDNEKIYLSKEL